MAFRKSSGEYILILDGDDRLRPNAIVDLLNGHRSNPEVGLVYGATRRIDETGRYLQSAWREYRIAAWEDPLEVLATRNAFAVHSALVKRSVLEELRELHTEEMATVGDWDLWSRVADQSKMLYVDAVVAEYRIHSSMSLKTLPKKKGDYCKRQILLNASCS